MNILGVDAINLRRGGGITHLAELLGQARPNDHGFEKVIVWSCRRTLAALPERDWLTKVCTDEAGTSFLYRLWWQGRHFHHLAREAGCNLLFVPGGTYFGDFKPVVTMSQNLLPFERREMSRFGMSYLHLRLFVLRLVQSQTFRRADAVIFLTQYAQNAVCSVAGKLSGSARIIPHGVGRQFRMVPRPQHCINAFGQTNPLRIVYVSTISMYKHQWNVVEAVAKLRADKGWPLRLEMIGGVDAGAQPRLEAAMRKHDPCSRWCAYLGEMRYEDLREVYAGADLAVFASSCENLPIILLEAMSAGLPIACSDRGPMPEILGDAGIYFDPERPESIAAAVACLVGSPSMREELARKAYGCALGYTWERCADETLNFFQHVLNLTNTKRRLDGINTVRYKCRDS